MSCHTPNHGWQNLPPALKTSVISQLLPVKSNSGICSVMFQIQLEFQKKKIRDKDCMGKDNLGCAWAELSHALVFSVCLYTMYSTVVIILFLCHGKKSEVFCVERSTQLKIVLVRSFGINSISYGSPFQSETLLEKTSLYNYIIFCTLLKRLYPSLNCEWQSKKKKQKLHVSVSSFLFLNVFLFEKKTNYRRH